MSSGSHPANRLSIIGRDYQIINDLARMLHKAVRREYAYTALRDTPDMRGVAFEVMLEDGRVARVTVELDRVQS